jgi:hypothetical protein
MSLQQPGRYSRKRLKTWEQWARWAATILRVERNNAAIAADPWRRKIHSLAVSARRGGRLRSVPPKPSRQRPKPTTWEEWAKREAERLQQEAHLARQTPWEKWARAKVVGLCLRRRMARGSM